MKEKVYGLRTSLIISVLSLGAALIIVILKQTEITGFMYDIMMGVFSGSVLTVLIYMTEYRAIKKSYLEVYYIKSIELLDKISKLEYFIFSNENKLILNYIRECDNNKWNNSNEQDAKIVLIEYYKCSDIKKDNLDTYLKHYADKAKQEIKDVVISYLELSKFKYRDIEDAYSNLYFFLNQNFRYEIYNKIHDNQRRTLNSIKEKSYHFDLYIKGAGNFLAVCSILEDIQNELFLIESRENNGLYSEIVHKKYCEEMEQVLENYRARIYKEEPQIIGNQIAVSYSGTIK